MGQVIRRWAAAKDILADVKATLTEAKAKGGVLEQLAEQRLGPVVAQFDDMLAQLGAARDALAPFRAAVRAQSEAAAQVVGHVSDEVWNAVGRPASDPALSVLFPGGIAHYVGRDVGSMPDRLDVLAQLLRRHLHPKLPDDVATAGATEVSKVAAALRSAVDAARAPQAQVDQLERVAQAIAVNAQASLAALKRLYRAAGFSEVDIHLVIPDRSPGSAPRSTPAASPPAPEPPAPPPTALTKAG